MSPKLLKIGALSFAGTLCTVLIAIMISLGFSGPRISATNANFSLVDDQNRPVNESIFHGQPALVYFGYTHCPEFCPTTLFEVADWLHTLGPKAKNLRALFFSVDPERDTPQVMHAYVNAITDRITGITGSPDEMRKVTNDWMIHASKIPSEDENYHMSHSVSLLMVGADGRLKGVIPYGTDRDLALSLIKSTLLNHS